MPPAWSILLVHASAAPPQTIALHERSPVVLVDVRDTLSARDLERVREAGDRLLRRDTSLELVAPAFVDLDRSAFTRCAGPERFTCWMDLARRARGDVRYVWLLAAAPSDDGFTARGLWLDVARAREAPNDASPTERENWIFENAVGVLPADVLVLDGDGPDRFVSTVLVQRVAATIRDAGAWRPFGAITLAAGEPGLVIELDGRTIGTTVAAPTRIEGVRRGPHSLAIHDGDAVAFEGTVEAGDDPPPVPLAVVRAPERDRTLHTVATYGGFAIATAGVVLVAVAAANGPAAAAGVCRGADCPPRRRSGWLTSCQLGGADDACLTDPSGVLVPGLGLALFAGGASLGLGGLFFERDDDVPWWSVAIGAAVALVVYGSSVLFAYPEGV